MRFLIDNALSPAVAIELTASATTPSTSASWACRPPQTRRSSTARAEERVVVSADTDFGTLLATRKETWPSVILFRHGSQHRPTDQAALLKNNLPQFTQALEDGSIVVIEPDRIRIRALPLIP